MACNITTCECCTRVKLFNDFLVDIEMGVLTKLRPELRSWARTSRPGQWHLSRRTLYLAPPFLIDDYIPRYHFISSVDAAKKRSLAYAHLRECNLCPRNCGVNRYEKTGVCLIGAETVKVNTIAPHFGEGTANRVADTGSCQDQIRLTGS